MKMKNERKSQGEGGEGCQGGADVYIFLFFFFGGGGGGGGGGGVRIDLKEEVKLL